jgi:hypothetical protein
VRSEERLAWVAIIISIIAAAFTGLEWWDSHRQGQLASDATVTFDVDTDNNLGFGVRNVGPGVAHIRSVKFYLDGKQIFDVDDVIDQAKLDSNRLLETEITDDYMGPGEIIWILKYRGRKNDQDRAADLFENHLTASVEYCAAGGRCATECTERGKCLVGQ